MSGQVMNLLTSRLTPRPLSFRYGSSRPLLAAVALAVGVLSFWEKASASALTKRSDDELAGGSATVFDESRNAFSLPIPNLDAAHRASFFVGNSFFNQNWVAAPASTTGRDGLGPLFNARSCSACHFKDGRSQPPEKGTPFTTILLRVSALSVGPRGGPVPDPVYGDQIQGNALPGARAEGDVFVDYEDVDGTYGDGEKYTLKRPSYRIENLAYGPTTQALSVSARVAPAMIGLGLLEAVPDDAINALADAEDHDGDGISGRRNIVWDEQAQKMEPGRFGWKAEQPSLLQQIAGAFRADMGLTTSLLPTENHTVGESECDRFPSGGNPEVSDKILGDVLLYSRALAVPAPRTNTDPSVIKGKALFSELQCISCHFPTLTTGEFVELPEIAHQIIHPYTDLLLHDMGENLADHRPVFAATGSEWRTPPLWGLGLLPKVNGHGRLLHDGRARGFAEAILWHGGEAERSRDGFRSLSAADRAALVAFLQSL